MIQIHKFEVNAYDIKSHYIKWEIVSTSENIDDYRFEVLRSGSPEGPFLSITQPFIDQYHFTDIDAPSGNPKRKYYYKIKVTYQLTGDERIHPDKGVSLGSDLDLIGLELSRWESLKHVIHTARPVWIYPVRTFGQYCGCFDPVRKRRTRSNCMTCYDTGFVGGFLTPMQVNMDIQEGPEVQQASTMPTHVVQTQAIGRLPHYPPVKVGDIIIERENKRWRVSPIDDRTRRRSLYARVITLGYITPGDIIYSLPHGGNDHPEISDFYRKIRRAT